MKLCACLPLRYDPEKSMLRDAILSMRKLCDEVIVMHDFASSLPPVWLLASEDLRVTRQKDPSWNDWTNRLTLAARATRLGCDVIMWLDDDELPGITLTYDRCRELCQQMLDGNYGQVIVRVRHAWNDTQWRADGMFGQAKKTFFQVNPLMLKSPVFKWGPDKQLHHFPNLDLPALEVDDHIVHWGLRTPALREKNIAKYEAADSECKFSCVPYSWLRDTQNIELRPLDE